MRNFETRVNPSPIRVHAFQFEGVNRWNFNIECFPSVYPKVTEVKYYAVSKAVTRSLSDKNSSRVRPKGTLD